jgi:hypothetical protein
VVFTAADLDAKRLGLLHDLVPTAAIAALIDPAAPGAELSKKDLEKAGKTIGRQVLIVEAADEGEFHAAITGTADCWARAASGQAAADPVITLMKSRRRIAAPKAQSLCGLCFGTTQLQQGFMTGGIGSDRHVAWQQSSGLNVRFGSKADIHPPSTDVRFTPKSGHWLSGS